MKKMKKFFALLIAMVMVLGMTTMTALADGTDGTITVDNAAVGKEYKAYKILDATNSGDAISYSTKTPANFTDSPFTVSTQVDSDGNYAVTIADTVTVQQISTWIKANISKFTAISATQGVDASDVATATTVKWTGLNYGYYYITSGLGSEVTITSVAKDATVQDKNTTNPKDPDKTVNEASGKIGDPVSFTVTLTATNYITTNTTDANGKVTATTEKVTKYTVADSADGFDYVIDATHPVTVKVGNREAMTIDNSKITFTNQTAAGAPGTMTFEIPWVNSETSESLYNYEEKITVTYSGKINKYAVDGNAVNTVNIANNTEKNPLTDNAETTTGEFTIAKVDRNNAALEGAKFRLYDAQTGGNEIAVVLENGAYRVAEANETGVEIEANQGDAKNLATIKGLDKDTNVSYWLEETVAPKGYNKLTARQEVKADGTATINVVNEKGSVLPSTGGIGTTIFYIIGAILVIGAGVVLVTRRRMNANK